MLARVETYDLAIIGTGSGNTILDERYAGKRVAICEQGTFGGTCLNVGCIPTKMFVYAAEVAQTVRDAGRYGVDARVDGIRWDDIVSRVFGRIDPIGVAGENYRRSAPNIDVYDSHTRFGPAAADGRHLLRTEGGAEFTAEQVVIAAGARPRIPAAIRDSGVHYYTSDDVMRIAELPEHLVIVGGGFVAAEFAHIFSALGVRVTIVIRGGALLRHCDDDICRRFTRIAAAKWDLRSHRNVVGARQDGRGVTLELDDGSGVHADALLVATGRVPNGDLLDGGGRGARDPGSNAVGRPATGLCVAVLTRHHARGRRGCHRPVGAVANVERPYRMGQHLGSHYGSLPGRRQFHHAE